MAVNETDKATDLIASGLARVILYAPDLSGNDIHLEKAFILLTTPYRDELDSLSEDILGKVGIQLKSKVSVDRDIYSDGMIKAQMMLELWSNPVGNEN